jgi:hypothetical protein
MHIDFYLQKVVIKDEFQMVVFLEILPYLKKKQIRKFSMPDVDTLPKSQQLLSYVFVVHNEFPLYHRLMNPQSGAHEKGSTTWSFNYRLSTVRRIIERKTRVQEAAMLLFYILKKITLTNVAYLSMIVVTHNFRTTE